MINLKGKRGIIEALEANGFAPVKKHFRDGSSVLAVSNEAAAQAFVDSYSELPHVKKQRIKDIRVESVSRIGLVYPWIDAFDKLDIVRDLYLSIAPAAREPKPGIATLIAIQQAATAAIAAVRAANDSAAVDAVVVAWP